MRALAACPARPIGTSHLAARKTHKRKRNLRGTKVLHDQFSTQIKTVLADYIPTSLDHTILCDATAGSFDLLLPKAPQAQGLYLVVKKVDATANTITLSEQVDASIVTLSTQYQSVTIQSDGVTYSLLASV